MTIPDGPDARHDYLSEVVAEMLHIVERLITAPRAGTFHPSISDLAIVNRARIGVGDPVGVVVNSGEKDVLESPFSGVLGGLLVLPGERVRRGQPVAWLTVDDQHDLA